MLKFTIYLALVAYATAAKVSYNNYTVFRVSPSTNKHINVLKSLTDTDGIAFWTSPISVTRSTDLMVAPEQQDYFTNLMDTFKVKYESFIDNVQHLIDIENPTKTRDGTFGWKNYHTLDEIYDWLEKVGKTYPDITKVVVGGRSYKNGVIKGIHLSYAKGNPGVFIEGGIHAREWISPATVTYLLNEFLTSTDPEVRKLAESYDWYFFPTINPDGYKFTHTSNRLWRKTRSRVDLYCHGVDANRNWAYKWNMGGSSQRPCSETFSGRSGFSEIETRTLSNYIKSIAPNLFAYIAFHSYSQLLLFPYGHTADHLENYSELKTIADKTVLALSKRYGTKYTTGSVAETLYVATGSSVDWAKGFLKLPIAYTYELRDRGQRGFLLPASQIIPNGQEVLDSFVTLFNEAAKFGYGKRENQH